MADLEDLIFSIDDLEDHGFVDMPKTVNKSGQTDPTVKEKRVPKRPDPSKPTFQQPTQMLQTLKQILANIMEVLPHMHLYSDEIIQKIIKLCVDADRQLIKLWTSDASFDPTERSMMIAYRNMFDDYRLQIDMILQIRKNEILVIGNEEDDKVSLKEGSRNLEKRKRSLSF